jgi:hypothetical protein
MRERETLLIFNQQWHHAVHKIAEKSRIADLMKNNNDKCRIALTKRYFFIESINALKSLLIT